MKKTVAKIIHKGTYRVVFDDSTRCNPYTIYKEYYTAGGDKHRQTIVKYQDMASCMYHLTEEVIKH